MALEYLKIFPMFHFFFVKRILIFVILFYNCVSFAGLLFTYNELRSKNQEQMSKIVADKIKESQKTRFGKNVPLKEALQAVLSRPNSDDMVGKIILPLDLEIKNISARDKTVSTLVDEAVGALKNPKAFKPIVLATYCIFLENLVAEYKPFAKRDGFESKILNKIRNAKLNLPEAVISEIKKNLDVDVVSPSLLAENVINAPEPQPDNSHDQKAEPKVENNAPIENK